MRAKTIAYNNIIPTLQVVYACSFTMFTVLSIKRNEIGHNLKPTQFAIIVTAWQAKVQNLSYATSLTAVVSSVALGQNHYSCSL